MMNTENRVSPQAPEIEEAILGACLIEQEAMPLVADKTPRNVLRATPPDNLRRHAGDVSGGYQKSISSP